MRDAAAMRQRKLLSATRSHGRRTSHPDRCEALLHNSDAAWRRHATCISAATMPWRPDTDRRAC